MASHTEAPDLAVDELKRRARRRLVGAVVLALAAAVILPLLLESDPKPLGSDVSIQIPPIDNSKFVTPLSPDKGVPAKPPADVKSDASGDAKSDGKATSSAMSAAAPRGVVEAEQRVLGQGAPRQVSVQPSADSGAATTPPTPAAEPNVAAADKPDAVAVPPAEPKAAASDKPKVAVETKSNTSASASAAASGGFQIQLAAFADAKAATELARKVKASGFAVRTEEVPTRKGPVQRVRVGPFATKTAAETAVTKLKSLGYANAQVVAAK